MYNKPLFTLFGKGVYLYGLLIAVGIICCLLVFYFYTKKKKMPAYVQDFSFVVTIIAIILGFIAAKLYQAIYDWIDSGFKSFNFMGAGITAMGGFIGGGAAFILAYFVGGKYFFIGDKLGIHKQEFNKIVLVAPCCITIAHAFGRLGCLCAGCCHGEHLGLEHVVGGLYMSPSGESAGYYVPTQLYEALFLFILFGVLTLLYFKNFNITMQVYLISYGVWRIIIEFFRDDYRGAMILGLYPSQWQSIIFIAGGIALFIFYAVKKYPFRLKKISVSNSDNSSLDSEDNNENES